jgi:hypothetical protein
MQNERKLALFEQKFAQMRGIFEFIAGSSLFIEKIGTKGQGHRGTKGGVLSF